MSESINAVTDFLVREEFQSAVKVPPCDRAHVKVLEARQ